MRTKLETMEFVGWNAIVCVLILTASHEVVTAQSVVPPPAVSVTPVVSRQVTETGTTSFSTARWRSRVAHMDDADRICSALPRWFSRRPFFGGIARASKPSGAGNPEGGQGARRSTVGCVISFNG